MTLTEALAALHRAGKIASPWLPGMHGFDTRGVGFRVLLMHHSGGAIVMTDGMITQTLPVSAEFMGMAIHDLQDRATIGCLLALAREVWGDPGLHACPHSSGTVWWVYTGQGHGPIAQGPTEAEALAACIIAAAEALEAP